MFKIFLQIVLFLTYFLVPLTYQTKTKHQNTMKTSIYQKQLVSKYKKKPIKELVFLYDLAMHKIVAAYSQPIEAEELTKIQTQFYILSDIIEQKRKSFEFED